MDEVRLDNCHEPGRLPWVFTEFAGLELATRLHMAVNKTKPNFTKAVAACLENLLMNGHLQ